MDLQPYIPGFNRADSGPLSRFLPVFEEGVVSAWLSHLDRPSAWLLDPFGFSPRLVLEAARSGYRVLVTANNPVTRFLLEISANPPAQSEFTAALADLGAVKKGDERLSGHLQSLYLTSCERCGQHIQAHSYLWRKGDKAPYARIYECSHCGDSGERIVSAEDIERAWKIAETDTLHRARAFEKVAALNNEDRQYAEEAIQHYLPRPLYVLTTIINRLDSINLPAERKRALTALTLLACDAGNTLWAHPAERPRPKQLSTPAQFREHNIWMMLERGLTLWTETGSAVTCEAWPMKIPESGGILIYEGRLKDLARIVKKEIPISAVIGSVPRPNQAFWTLCALWAGWLWGKEALEPYKVALRRRRYDWAWNATALHSAFNHLSDLLPDGTPFFALLPEPEPAFLTSAFSAASASTFALQSVAMRTEHDAVQVIWKNEQKQKAQPGDVTDLQNAIHAYLSARGEPANYLHIHAAGLIKLAEARALKLPEHEFDEALRKTSKLFEAALKDDGRFIHYSAGENIETGMWGLRPAADKKGAEAAARRGDQNAPHQDVVQPPEALSDRVEIEVVKYLQKNKSAIYLEVENELYPKFTGLLTPSKGLIYAVLNSYAEKDGGMWRLRREDTASARREELNSILTLIESIGKRLEYKTSRRDKFVRWEENGISVKKFHVMVSALIDRALHTDENDTILVIPGGRAALIAYKQERDPSLAARLKNHRFIKFRFLRTISEVPILTRETFEEQISNDPVEQSANQMMMF